MNRFSTSIDAGLNAETVPTGLLCQPGATNSTDRLPPACSLHSRSSPTRSPAASTTRPSPRPESGAARCRGGCGGRESDVLLARVWLPPRAGLSHGSGPQGRGVRGAPAAPQARRRGLDTVAPGRGVLSSARAPAALSPRLLCRYKRRRVASCGCRPTRPNHEHAPRVEGRWAHAPRTLPALPLRVEQQTQDTNLLPALFECQSKS